MGVARHPERDRIGVQKRQERSIRMKEDPAYALEQRRKAAINGGKAGRGRQKPPVSLAPLAFLTREPE
jgi:hypothetical protein